MKSTTVRATTEGNGIANLGYTTSQIKILNIYANNELYAVPFVYGNTWFAKLLFYTSNANVPNYTADFTIYYV